MAITIPNPELGWIRSTQGHNELKQNFRRCMECKQGFHYGMDYAWVPIECPYCGTVSARHAK